MFRKYLFHAAVFVFFSHLAYSQESTQVKLDDYSVPFYKWEVGIDLLPLADKSKDMFGYMVKRNFQTVNGRQALRFKLLPRFISGPGGSGADAKDSSIKLALGFERQKMYGHFSVLDGLEPYFSYRTARTKSTTTGIVVTSQNDTSFGVAGFVGGRYYVGNHVGFTIESHLVYQFQDQNGSIDNVGSYFARTHILFAEPLHAVYVSYQF